METYRVLYQYTGDITDTYHAKDFETSSEADAYEIGLKKLGYKNVHIAVIK